MQKRIKRYSGNMSMFCIAKFEIFFGKVLLVVIPVTSFRHEREAFHKLSTAKEVWLYVTVESFI